MNSAFTEEFSPNLPPVADLENQITVYMEKLARDIEDLALTPNFADGSSSLYRDANTLALIALALGKSSEESGMKAATPGLIAAAQQVARSQNNDEAKAAYQAVQDALKSTGNTDDLKWEKVAHLSPVMKKSLPSLTTEIKRLSRNEKTFLRSSNSGKVIGLSATLVAIAAGCRPNVDETLAPTEENLWNEYCSQLYEASMKLNQAAHAVVDGTAPFDDFTAAFKQVDATCNTTCHEKFGGASAK